MFLGLYYYLPVMPSLSNFKIVLLVSNWYYLNYFVCVEDSGDECDADERSDSDDSSSSFEDEFAPGAIGWYVYLCLSYK